jgi:hypothetical protein
MCFASSQPNPERPRRVCTMRKCSLSWQQIRSVPSKAYQIGILTVPKWSLHPLAVFGAPPLRFSLSFRAKTHAVQATGLKPVSDWCPAACCCRKHSTSISSSTGFHEAFLREAAGAIEGVTGVHCTQSVCCDAFWDPKLVTSMFSLLPDRDIIVR